MNENCLEGLKCPNCGNEEPFNIVSVATFKVYDDGTDEFGDVAWDDSSFCECPGCGKHGCLGEFRTGLLEKERSELSAKRKYLQSGHAKCPYTGCEIDDIEGGFVEIDANGAHQTCMCHKCGRSWEDVYTLTDVKLLDGIDNNDQNRAG